MTQGEDEKPPNTTKDRETPDYQCQNKREKQKKYPKTFRLYSAAPLLLIAIFVFYKKAPSGNTGSNRLQGSFLSEFLHLILITFELHLENERK